MMTFWHTKRPLTMISAQLKSEFLGKIIDDPELIRSEDQHWALDEILQEIILIEKRHMFQIEGSTTNTRRSQIRKLLDSIAKETS